MHKHIEVIKDNAGGITIQNTENLSDPEYYITDDTYRQHESSGGYRLLSAEDIKEMLEL